MRTEGLLNKEDDEVLKEFDRQRRFPEVPAHRCSKPLQNDIDYGNLPRVLERMTGGAEGDQVVFGVVSALTATLFVMNL
jgi:hypothetical protein